MLNLSESLSHLPAASSAGGGEEGPALDAVDQEVAVGSEGRIVEGLTWLGPTFVEVSVEPESELAPAGPDDEVLEAALQKLELLRERSTD